MGQSPSSEASSYSYSQEIPAFLPSMELEYSGPCSQRPASGHYTKHIMVFHICLLQKTHTGKAQIIEQKFTLY
jgi:hypothetical protein